MIQKLTLIITKNIWTSIIAIATGSTLGLIGLDPHNATPRLTMGFMYLEDGIPHQRMIFDLV